MKPTKHEAQALLAGADQTGQAVHARTPREHAPFIAWGAFLALVIPGFDIVDRTVWGYTTMAVALALFVATAVYFIVRERDVRVADRTPSLTWVALTAGVCFGGVIAEGLDGALAFSYVLGGIVAAVPLLAWGQRLRTDA